MQYPENSENDTSFNLSSSRNQQKDINRRNYEREISTSACSETLSISNTQIIQSSYKEHDINESQNNNTKEGIYALKNSLNDKFNSLSIKDDSPPLNTDNISNIVEEKPRKKSKKKIRRAIPPLKASLFCNVPPTTYFGTSSERILPLPRKIRNELLWKISNITPRLITQTVLRSGFRLTKDVRWISTWGKHMKCNEFKYIKNIQKINHFPGSFHLGRKDRLWLNIIKMQYVHDTTEFSFVPDTYILPEDLVKLRQVWEEENKKLWIVKPPASARGLGIDVIYKWSDVPKHMPAIVQKYLSQPFLINGSKFDLRIYVLVTSFDPLRIYVFDDGLVRFASVQYSRAIRFIGEKFMHLTNYSINRKNSSYTVNDDDNSYEGHKWSLKLFWDYLKTRNIDTEKLWSSIVDIVIKTLISAEDSISKLVKFYIKSNYCCYELFGFDIMIDDDLKPWLLEVNISPSLHSNSQLDTDVKSQLVKDMFNTIGFRIPDDIKISPEKEKEILEMCNITPENTTRLCINHDLYQTNLSHEERVKHIRYEQEWCEESILKDLTSDDVRHLIESEDELARCGHFIRVFPSEISSYYLKFFEKQKYYNLLLDSWEKRFQGDRKSGVELLQMLCEVGKHLQFGSVPEEHTIIKNPKPPLSIMVERPERDAIIMSRV